MKYLIKRYERELRHLNERLSTSLFMGNNQKIRGEVEIEVYSKILMDLNKLERALDGTLSNETEESMTEWLNNKRKLKTETMKDKLERLFYQLKEINKVNYPDCYHTLDIHEDGGFFLSHYDDAEMEDFDAEIIYRGTAFNFEPMFNKYELLFSEKSIKEELSTLFFEGNVSDIVLSDKRHIEYIADLLRKG